MNLQFPARFFLTALLLWLGAAVGAQAQIISDGNFDGGTDPWTFSTYIASYNGNTYNTASIDSSTFHSSPNSALIDPNQYVHIHGSEYTPAGYISETLHQTLTVGSYTLSFWYSAANGASFSVSIGGVTAVSSTSLAAASSWTQKTNVTINVTSAMLSGGNPPVFTFSNSSTSASDVLIVDDMVMTQTPGPLPGAGLFSYVALGLAGFGLGGRKLMARARPLFAGGGA